jgi:hypothetical protein
MEIKMKNIILALTFLLSLNSHGFTLTPEKEAEILSNLKKACSRVWCTGNYKIDFKSLKCKELANVETKCILTADFKLNKVKEYDEKKLLRLAGLQKTYPGICYFIVSKSRELQNRNGEISKKFYKDVDACVTQVEKFIEE